MQDILEKIKSTGYWKVILRPKEFHNELITPLSLCKNYLESSAVTLRGWSYPHIESHLISNGQDWVEHHTDYTDRPEFGYVEFVRLYQSGQFYHLFACREDYSVSTDEIPSRSVKTTSPTNKYLSILATLYTITEIYFFASKLFKHLDTDGISVDISLNDSVGRQLFFYDKSRYLRRDYRCTIPSIVFSKIYSTEEIVANFEELALHTVTFFFERFNWEITSPKMFYEEQQKFLERRLF